MSTGASDGVCTGARDGMMARVEVITGPERRTAERRCRRSQLRLMPARRIAEISPGLPAAGGGRHLVFGRLGMDVRHAVVPGILEQEVGHPRGARFQCHLHRHRHDHSIHARRVGRGCRRLPGNDRQCSLPDEGRGSPCDITLPSDAGPPEGIALHWHRRVSAKPKTPAIGEHRRQAQAAGPQ